ncbi:PspC domain-containing protein [Brevibacillus massiliensis]|uniref:PspC domain-containing protein n=1 Tax=Brevibacillus massiliensis TaxID=1118054 RepID=UPI0002E5962E|nr:PspC domain-containing protein [Brevibacillus massiliensis]
MNRLYRSRYDKKLFGLCGGIAKFLQIDATLVRVIFVLVSIFTVVPVFFYFLLSFIVPKEPSYPFAADRFYREFPDFAESDELDWEIDRVEKQALQQEVYRLRAELSKFRSQ